METALERSLAKAGLERNFLTVITMVEVDANDPLFKNPTKPIGPFYTDEEAAGKSYPMVRTDKGMRRVIASPQPIGIAAADEIKQLIDMDWILICSGGGGIPVIRDGEGGHVGADAVIDKDLASSLLAREIGADLFVIATDVPGACINWGKPDQEQLRKVSLDEMQKYVDEGQFPAGSMGPKVSALMSFVQGAGKQRAIICQLDEIEAALAGEAGTEITA
jgi:carbamate kinase